MVSTARSPTTRSALPRRIGSTSLGMSAAEYWLSASVLTTTSAPSFSDASRPAWKPEARPLLLVSRTTWSTPCSRAVATVPSVEPSSMINHSTSSNPGTSRGSSRSVTGRVSSSLRHGIWMISFIARRTLPSGAHGERGAHPAGTGLRDSSARTVRRYRHACQGRLRRAVRGLPRGVPDLPDVPELRLLLLAAVGPRGARSPGAALPGFPGADRAPAGDRRGRAHLPAGRGRGPRLGGDDAGLLPLARVGHVPARADRLHAARRGDRGRAAADPLRLRVPRRARLHRRPVHGARGVGGGARGAHPAARRARVRAARGGGAAAPRGVDPRGAVLPLDESRRDVG